MGEPAHLDLPRGEGRQGWRAAVAVRRRSAEYADAQRLESEFTESRRHDHHRRRAGEGRLEDVQRAHGEARRRTQRVRRIFRRRQPAAAETVAAMTCRAAIAAVICAAGLSAVAAAQRDFQPPSGPTPPNPRGKVDFSGVWSKPYVPDVTKDGKDQKGMAVLPFTPWGEADWKKYDAAEGDYTGACLPFGMTRSVNTPEPM